MKALSKPVPWATVILHFLINSQAVPVNPDPYRTSTSCLTGLGQILIFGKLKFIFAMTSIRGQSRV